MNLCTRDIEAGVRFYRNLLAFTETFRTPAEGNLVEIVAKVA